MPTREYTELVSVIAETLEHMIPPDLLMPPDHIQTADAAGISAPVYAFVLDGEKIVWHFPDAPSRLIEDTV